MHIDQADLFEGMDRLFIQGFMALTAMERYTKGDFIFHMGEAFGLSSILERNYYFASASCLEPTQLLKIEGNALNQFLQDHPKNSGTFYKRIANRLAQRLVECYKFV